MILPERVLGSSGTTRMFLVWRWAYSCRRAAEVLGHLAAGIHGVGAENDERDFRLAVGLAHGAHDGDFGHGGMANQGGFDLGGERSVCHRPSGAELYRVGPGHTGGTVSVINVKEFAFVKAVSNPDVDAIFRPVINSTRVALPSSIFEDYQVARAQAEPVVDSFLMVNSSLHDCCSLPRLRYGLPSLMPMPMPDARVAR
jgi:hypothetical protein